MAIKDKRIFIWTFFSTSKVPSAIKLEEGGGGAAKAVMALPLKKDF